MRTGDTRWRGTIKQNLTDKRSVQNVARAVISYFSVILPIIPALFPIPQYFLVFSKLFPNNVRRPSKNQRGVLIICLLPELHTYNNLLYTFLLPGAHDFLITAWPLSWLPVFKMLFVHACGRREGRVVFVANIKQTPAACSHAVAMMWRVSPALPGILSVIGFSGSGLASSSGLGNKQMVKTTCEFLLYRDQTEWQLQILRE